MKYGDIYVAIYPSGNRYINLYEGRDSFVKKYISVSENSYYDSIATRHESKIEKATSLEKRWLLECIEQNRFIPLEDIKVFYFGR